MRLPWSHRKAIVACSFITSSALIGARPLEWSSLASPPKKLPTTIRVFLATNPKGAFRTFADGLPLQTKAPQPIPRHEPDTVCEQGQTDAIVTIWAIKDSKELGHRKSYRNGRQSLTYVIGRIEVTGCDFVEIGLKRGRRAYWVVEPDDDLILTSHIVDVGPIASPTDPEKEVDLTKDAPWGFYECPQQHSSLKDDDAAVQPRSKVCVIHDDARVLAARGRPQIFAAARATLAKRVDPPLDPYLWILCADGCCYAGKE